MSVFNFKKLKQEYYHLLSVADYSVEKQPQSLFTSGVGLRSGKAIMDGLIDRANEIWGSQTPGERGSVNTVVILTMGRNEEESLVTMLFNPGIQCNENNMPELEADAYIKAIEYLHGASINRGQHDKRISLAMERIRQSGNGKSSVN